MERQYIPDLMQQAVDLVKGSAHTTVFTGAGISVESGVPPFRGKDGLWSRFDPVFLDINYFHKHPGKSWKLIKEIFYDYFGQAKPNAAHFALALLEKKGIIHSIITQNIDNLHQAAGSHEVYEFHGNSRQLICTNCATVYQAQATDLSHLPPRCKKCKGVLKPDFVFFGEPIPEPAGTNSYAEIIKADVFILIGTTGEIMPASIIPYDAKKNNTKIIEINVEPSNFTRSITDIFLEGQATEVMSDILSHIAPPPID